MGEPQTVREVHHVLCTDRMLAYTTVMTVLRRLAGKHVVAQIRDGRAYRYTAAKSRDELAAGLMMDVLDDVADERGRHAALVHFVGRFGPEEAVTLRQALAAVDAVDAVERRVTCTSP